MARTARPSSLGVEVFAENELVDRLARGAPHYRACISIGNPRPLLRKAQPGETVPPHVRNSFESLLRLSFYDLEEPMEFDGLLLERLPHRGDVQRVLRFFDRTKGWTDGWTIHCWAGVSRSTAVALALLFLLRGDEDQAAAELGRIRPQALPNRLLLRRFDEVLGSRLGPAAQGFHAANRESQGRGV